MANVLPYYVLVMHRQRLELLVTYITEVNPVSLCLSWEAFSSPLLEGISTGFIGVWWWEVHKEVVRGPRERWPSCPLPPPGCPTYPPHPFSSISSSSSPHHSPPFPHYPSTFPHYTPPFPPPSGSLEGVQALPPRLQGPVGKALECLHTGLVSSSPPGSKIIIGLGLYTGYKILTGFTGNTRHYCTYCLINCNTSEKCIIHCKKV